VWGVAYAEKTRAYQTELQLVYWWHNPCRVHGKPL